MIVLEESASAQTFKIIPRGVTGSLTADSMDITEEGVTATPTNYLISLTGSGYYREITKIVVLEEDKYYTLIVKNGSDIVYKDKIFCTNQTISDYSINNGDYTQQSSDDEYIVI